MNICLFLISDGWGGAETVVDELARHLRDKGENVSIILNQEILKFYNDLEDVEIFNIGHAYNYKMLIKSIISLKPPKINKETALSLLPGPISNEILYLIYFKRINNRLMQFLLEKNIDIIHSHLENADILVSRFNSSKIPQITTIHGPHLTRSESTFKKWKAKIRRGALHNMDKIIFVSNWLFNNFNNIMPIQDKSVVIRNGIKLSDFQKNLIPTQKLKGKFNLLFPGGARSAKGGDILIETVHKIKNKMPNIHLYIALNVPGDHLLRKMVKNYKLEQNVTFSGFMPVQDYRRLLNSVDILVTPSKEEGFGIVILEAMALGKPIVTTRVGGIPEVIKNRRNGIFVERNSDEIANAILYLYKNENKREEMKKNNIQDVKKFDWNTITDKYIDVYKKILAERK